MTNEKAIERLTAFRDYLCGGNPIWDVDECKEAFDIALAAMSESNLDEWCDNCKEYDHKAERDGSVLWDNYFYCDSKEDRHCCPRFNRVIRKTVEEVKQNAEQKWIPVSEAMPEEADGTVLVCMPNKFPYNEKEPFVNAKHNRQVETATYSQYSDTWHFKNGGVTSVRPIAWMPLPMPWRGEEDE